MKTVAAIFITDTHLSKDNVALVKDVFNQLRDLCISKRCSRVIHGGDVFTSRSGQPLSCLVAWNDILSDFAKSGIKMDVIAGNHDKTDGDDERSYLDVFESKTFCVHRDGGCFNIGDITFAMMPYFKEEKWLDVFSRVDEEVDEEDKPIKFLITHIGFDGVMNNDGSKVKSAIRPSDFKKYTKVLIGHYHNASTLGKNVCYTGSAYQCNFGETIPDKGFTLIYSDGSTEHVRSEFPQYRKTIIDVKDKEALREALEEVEESKSNGDHIRFVFRGSKTDCDKVNVSELQTNYGIDCKFEVEETTRAMDFAEDESVASYDKSTILSDFEEFCNESEISKKKRTYAVKLLSEI